jgi:hypothetical protein
VKLPTGIKKGQRDSQRAVAALLVRLSEGSHETSR